ncbi:uncharacterized protein y4hQ [Nephila pilipes]|uniref:Uncharacterized protein y4hQ n=1 Tax=Nephila pilipes TaxID=299642 RepID=A0A8X6IUY2_NEPPI|nr:uncharacterized protein y4hQ [Nephila pilipes]
MTSEDSRIFQFKISLKCIKPKIWRRIQVPSSYNFLQLHYAIQDSMGWKSRFTDYHLHVFRRRFGPFGRSGCIEIGKPIDTSSNFMGFWDRVEIVPEEVAKIDEYFGCVKTKYVYLYDFGDDWEHEIVLEKVLPAVEGYTYPKCISGKRACPPEDCGGYDGYDDHLKIVRNSKHPEHKKHLEWVKSQDAKLDPEEFDPKAVKFYEGNPNKGRESNL